MNRIVAGITSLAQHSQTLSQTPEHYRPRSCPHCGVRTLWGHGHYFRKADLEHRGAANANPVPIPRYCCAGCGQTCSRLPECIAPRRWYNWLWQQIGLRPVVEARPATEQPPGPTPARRTIGRWWNWLQARTPLFRFHLTSRFPELGRILADSAFWSRVFGTLGLSGAMTWLDQAVNVP